MSLIRSDVCGSGGLARGLRSGSDAIVLNADQFGICFAPSRCFTRDSYRCCELSLFMQVTFS
jgi:hypothetical protein